MLSANKKILKDKYSNKEEAKQHGCTHSCMDGGIRHMVVSDLEIQAFYKIIATKMWSPVGNTSDLAEGCYISEIFSSIHRLMVDLDFTFTAVDDPDDFKNGRGMEEILGVICAFLSQFYETLGEIIVTSCTPTVYSDESDDEVFKCGIHVFFKDIFVSAKRYRILIHGLKKHMGLVQPLNLLNGSGKIKDERASKIVDTGVKSIRLFCAKKFQRRCKFTIPGHEQCSGKCNLGVSDMKGLYRRYEFCACYEFEGGALEVTEKHRDLFDLAEDESSSKAVIKARMNVLKMLSMRVDQDDAEETKANEEFILQLEEKLNIDEPETKEKKVRETNLKKDDPRRDVLQSLCTNYFGAQGKLKQIKKSGEVYKVDFEENICPNHPLNDGLFHTHASNGSYGIVDKRGYFTLRSHDEECKGSRLTFQIRNRKTIETLFAKPPPEIRSQPFFSNETSVVEDVLIDGCNSIIKYIDNRNNPAMDIGQVIRLDFFN